MKFGELVRISCELDVFVVLHDSIWFGLLNSKSEIWSCKFVYWSSFSSSKAPQQQLSSFAFLLIESFVWEKCYTSCVNNYSEAFQLEIQFCSTIWLICLTGEKLNFGGWVSYQRWTLNFERILFKKYIQNEFRLNFFLYWKLKLNCRWWGPKGSLIRGKLCGPHCLSTDNFMMALMMVDDDGGWWWWNYIKLVISYIMIYNFIATLVVTEVLFF